MPKEKTRVVIVDDELIALNRIKMLLSHFDDVDIIGQFSDPTSCVEFINSNHPDIVFLDIEMPNRSGVEIAKEIKRSNNSTKIVFVTGYEHYAIQAIKLEAFDYLLKPVNIDELQTTLNRFNNNSHINLTEREVEIIRHISDGENSKKIGERLHISRHTVDTHRRTILQKTNCSNAAELIKYAIKLNLV